MLSAENITFSYGTHPALADVTARFERGLTGVVGPNGSGKSTLVGVLSGELAPQRGAVTLDGRPIRRTRAKDLTRRMTVVLQKSTLDFDFTALDVVLMGRTPYIKRFGSETARDVGIAHEAMDAMHVRHLADRPVGQLSGGEWQRVVVARALCQQTDLMLLDEPVASLDIAHQLDVLRLVRRLTRAPGKAAVCVLHDLNLAAHFCDALIMLKGGRVLTAGTPREVLTGASVREAYGVEASVSIDKKGRPTVVPVYGDEADE